MVKHLTRIASFLKIPGFVAAFVFMAFSTTLPELFISITSALNKTSALALGTVIGSNIANLSIIIGIVIVLSRGIKVPSKNVRRDALYVFLIVFLLTFLMYLGRGLSRFDGALLIFVLFIYFLKIIKSRKKFSKEPMEKHRPKDIIFSFGVFIACLVGLILSANFVVEYGKQLAVDLALPPILIGLFLVALGTSLPDLVFQMKSAMSGQEGMSLGDALGAVVVNSTLVIGVAAIIHPIETDFTLFIISAGFMIVIAFIFLTFLESEDRLQIKEGISLIFLYVVFVIVELYIRSFEGKELF